MTNIYKLLEDFSQKNNLKFEKEIKPFPLGKREDLRIKQEDGKTILLLNFKQSASSSVVNKLFVLKASFKIIDNKVKIIVKQKSFLKKMQGIFKKNNFPFEINDLSSSITMTRQLKGELSNHLTLSQLSKFYLKIDNGIIFIEAKSFYEDFIEEAIRFVLKIITMYYLEYYKGKE